MVNRVDDVHSEDNDTTGKSVSVSVQSNDATIIRRGDGTYKPRNSKKIEEKKAGEGSCKLRNSKTTNEKKFSKLSSKFNSEQKLEGRAGTVSGSNSKKVENRTVRIKCNCQWLKFWKRDRLIWV
jgi:hypothetical protein